MKRLLLFVGLLLLAGCRNNLVGPFEHRKPARVDDPKLTLDEQKALGRERLPLPDTNTTGAPPSGVEVGPATGRYPTPTR